MARARAHIRRSAIYLGLAVILLGAAVLMGAITPFFVIPAFMALVGERFIARARKPCSSRRSGTDTSTTRRACGAGFSHRLAPDRLQSLLINRAYAALCLDLIRGAPMKTLVAALALAVGNAAFAADNAPAVTQWDQSQESLVRQFSQGFGFAIGEAHPFIVARADSASAGPTADSREPHHRRSAQARHTKLPASASRLR